MGQPPREGPSQRESGDRLTRQGAVQEFQMVYRDVSTATMGALGVETDLEGGGNAAQEHGGLPPAAHAGALGTPHHGLMGALLPQRGPQRGLP